MKLLIINEVCGVTSTGTLCADLAEYFLNRGHEVKVLYGRLTAPVRCSGYGVRVATRKQVLISALSSRVMDNCGLGNRSSTMEAIRFIHEFKPDVIHLHNLHGYYINFQILFSELEKLSVPVVYTLHDCWALTGHCAYFDHVGCNKWMSGCGTCPQKKEYPKSVLLDKSKDNWLKKENLYKNLSKMKVVTPSRWLGNLVKHSMLKRDAYVIPNGIDTSIFRPVERNYFLENCLTDKKVVLGVASIWEDRKGLSFFVELSKILPKEFRIVLVGVDNKQKSNLPNSILLLPRIDDRRKLASVYSSAYVYLNPTLEDNYPTTNLEAICCGTPVITFNTGGSAESASYYGVVCERNAESILEAILQVENIQSDRFIKIREYFDLKRMLKQYEDLYISLLSK